MSRPLALDLWADAGGVAEGLVAAGFDVVGVGLERPPEYPGRFVRGNPIARRFPFASRLFLEAELVWQRPPYSSLAFPEALNAARALAGAAKRSVVEGKDSTPLRADLDLTGPAVGLPRITYRRVLELEGWLCLQPGGVRGAAARTFERRAPRTRDELREALELRAPYTYDQCRKTTPPAFAWWVGSQVAHQIGRGAYIAPRP